MAITRGLGGLLDALMVWRTPRKTGLNLTVGAGRCYAFRMDLERMRAATFKVWGSLPSKIMSVCVQLAGLWATVKPELASALVDRMTTPEQMRLIGLASFAVGLAYWVVWLLLKPSAVVASAANPSVQTNQGAHSTTVHGEFHGNVYINDPNQGRAGEPQKKRPMEISENALRMASNVPPLEPDMVLTALLMRLYKMEGSKNSGACRPDLIHCPCG